MDEVTIEDLLETMPEIAYELVVVCTMCKVPHGESLGEDKDEAIEFADAHDRFIVDEENIPHNYQTAIIEVNRKVIYVPSRNGNTKS